MDLEGAEQKRKEAVDAAFTALIEIVKSKDAKNEDKIAASHVIDDLSDSIIKVHLANTSNAVIERSSSKIAKQLKDLHDDRSEYGD